MTDEVKELRELKKLGADTYELSMTKPKAENQPKVVTTVLYSKAQMKQNLEDSRTKKEYLTQQKHAVEKKLKALDVEDTPELRQFVEMAEKAGKLEQKKKEEERLKLIKADLERAFNDIKEIKGVIPEFFRDGKK